jgi:hypothetical protein
MINPVSSMEMYVAFCTTRHIFTSRLSVNRKDLPCHVTLILTPALIISVIELKEEAARLTTQDTVQDKFKIEVADFNGTATHSIFIS